MTLRDVLESTELRRGGQRCRTCLLLESLDGDDLEVLEEWLADRSRSSNLISRGLAQFGFTISGSALSRHRRECR